MRRYLIKDKMAELSMSNQDVAAASNGNLSYNMVIRQMSGKPKVLKDYHIKGWITALKLSDEEIKKIFFG